MRSLHCKRAHQEAEAILPLAVALIFRHPQNLEYTHFCMGYLTYLDQLLHDGGDGLLALCDTHTVVLVLLGQVCKGLGARDLHLHVRCLSFAAGIKVGARNSQYLMLALIAHACQRSSAFRLIYIDTSSQIRPLSDLLCIKPGRLIPFPHLTCRIISKIFWQLKAMNRTFAK